MSGSRSAGGREFQDDGPDEEIARGPRVIVCVCGMYSIISSADRRRERPVTAATGTQDWDKYVGALQTLVRHETQLKGDSLRKTEPM